MPVTDSSFSRGGAVRSRRKMAASSQFQANLALLARFDAKVAQDIQTFHPATISVPRGIKMHWHESLDLKDVTTLFVYGISPLGLEYVGVLKWLAGNYSRTVVFLIEDLSIARAFLETPIAEGMLKNPQAIFKVINWPADNNAESLRKQFEWMCKTFSTGKSLFVTHQEATDAERQRLVQLKALFLGEFEDWIRLYHNFLTTQREIFSQYYLNLLESVNARFGQGMRGAFKDVPAIICGAGPSLSPQLNLLRNLQDKALIFGAGSGVNVLSRHGISPHFAGGVDSTPTQASRISTNFAFEVPFFYLNRFNHEALRFIQGEKLVARGGSFLDVIDWFDEQLGLNVCDRVRPGVSTSNFCFEVASFLGCNPIILVGMDLSYKEGARYADGVTAHPSEERRHHQEIGVIKRGQIRARGVDGGEVMTTANWLREAECFHEASQERRHLRVLNATEGGMPIEGVPNVTLEEVAAEDLHEIRELDVAIHQNIQMLAWEVAKKDKIEQVLRRWEESLIHCKRILVEHSKWVELELGVLDKSSIEKPVDYFLIDLGPLLGDSPAYRYCLKQYNDVFDGLNGREYFRMAHYPEAYPAWKCVQVSGVMEVERCKFLIDKIDDHLSSVQRALQLFPVYPVIPHSSSDKKIDRLYECEDDGVHKTIKFYYLTGELYAVKRYVGGHQQGKQEYYYVNGELKTVLNYTEGYLDGEVRLFYSNQRPKRELYFVRGQLDGTEKMWNEDGALLKEVTYQQNKPVGVARSWHANGQLARETTYATNGEVSAMQEWDAAGHIL